MRRERSIGPAEVLAVLIVLASLVWMAAVVWETWRQQPETQVLGPAQHIERDAHEVALELAEAWPSTTLPPTTTTIEVPMTAARREVAPRVNRGAPARTSAAAGGGSIWQALAMCESGNRNDGGAPYYGYFQFATRTWQSLGYSGNADEHSYATQLEAAQRLQARSGFGQWPACSRKLGLR